MKNTLPFTALSESSAPADPLHLFERWYGDAIAAGLPLPNAMTLATATPDGLPAARTVLLKSFDDGSFVFFTNYESRKGRELDRHPHAALVFHWAQLERQVRIEGRVERVSAAESDAYFATRPLGSRHSAIASPQSEVVPDRGWLEREAEAVARRHPHDPPRPSSWGGYRVLPNTIEYWQGRSDRMHDRLRYRRAPDGWFKERLAP